VCVSCFGLGVWGGGGIGKGGLERGDWKGGFIVEEGGCVEGGEKRE
jgi:hypothetical protein